MRIFLCDACLNTVHFDNTACVVCDHRLGYRPDGVAMTALEPKDGGFHSPVLGRDFALCANAALDACNWLVPIERAGELCPACRHNRTIPSLAEPGALDAFRRITRDERHLFYSLSRWGLRPPTKAEDETAGLAFDFLADEIAPDGTPHPVMTGHDDGVITLSIAEADDAERERRRTDLGEPYRTLLGHFRHEIGHYFWDRLVRDGGRLEAFREIFGDERADYGEALVRHYHQGPPPDWPLHFVSTYASSHPWEDFAESWAHHMHMVDALETAHAFGLELAPLGSTDDALALEVDFDPYRTVDFRPLAAAWPPLTVALNAINRSLGQRDVYPFVMTAEIERKLAFVHDLVATTAAENPTATPRPA